LSRVLSVREIEKDQAEKAHLSAKERFENVARQFYTLLQKKERAELQYEQAIANISEIKKIKEQLTYIDQLNRDIVTLQQKVNQARHKMEVKQEKLTAAYI